MLVGAVFPDMTVASSTGDFASNVKLLRPGSKVEWHHDPMMYIIGALVILAGVANFFLIIVSESL